MLVCAMPSLSRADSFCGEALDSFDFNHGVFAGPDPDVLPNRIQERIHVLVEHQINTGAFSKKDAQYLFQSVLDEPVLLKGVAEQCQQEPNADIRVVDRVLKPRFVSETMVENRRINANQTARATLLSLFDACHQFWLDHDSEGLCTLESLAEVQPDSFHLMPKTNLTIDDATLTGFSAYTRHESGDREYHLNAQGEVIEIQ